MSLKGIKKDMSKREEIRISRSRWNPEVTVLLRSFLKEPRIMGLGHLTDSNIEKWWPISNEEELEESFKDIMETMNNVGWDWFVLP